MAYFASSESPSSAFLRTSSAPGIIFPSSSEPSIFFLTDIMSVPISPIFEPRSSNSS
jgi:hypothetical protein